MLPHEPQLIIQTLLKLSEVSTGGVYSIIAIRAQTILVLLPASDGVVFDFRGIGDKTVEADLHILDDGLIVHAIGINTMIAGHEEDKYVMLVVGKNIAFLVFVVVSDGGEEINHTHIILPKLILKADYDFVEHSETYALDSIFIGLW